MPTQSYEWKWIIIRASPPPRALDPNHTAILFFVSFTFITLFHFPQPLFFVFLCFCFCLFSLPLLGFQTFQSLPFLLHPFKNRPQLKPKPFSSISNSFYSSRFPVTQLIYWLISVAAISPLFAFAKVKIDGILFIWRERGCRCGSVSRFNSM